MTDPAVQAADEQHGGRNSRLGEDRIAPDGHRHRPGVPGLALEDALAAGQAGDPGDEPERHSGALEHRALLDVQLQKAGGKVAALDEGRAAAAAGLLVAEGDDGTGARALDRLDRRDDAERAVELPTCWDGVEVRSGPDRGVRGPA